MTSLKFTQICPFFWVGCAASSGVLGSRKVENLAEKIEQKSKFKGANFACWRSGLSS
jgi:hypothetical protein